MPAPVRWGALTIVAAGLGSFAAATSVFGQQQSPQESATTAQPAPPAATIAPPAAASAPQAAPAPVAAPKYGPPAPTAAAATVPPGIDPLLARAADLAITRYPSLKAANALVRATEQDVRAAKWLRFPSASVSAATRGYEIDPQLEIFQPLYAGGRIDGSIERAEAVNSVSRAEVGVTAFEILNRVARAYYGVVRGIRVGAILDESLAEHQRLVESMERRVSQEVSPRSDLDLARSRTAQVRQDLSVVTAQRYAALQQLRELVGDPTFEVDPLPVYDKARHHPRTEDLVQAALTCDPSIRRLQAETEVAEADRKLAKAGLFPKVGVQYSHDRFRGSAVGLAVQANTNGGLSPVAAASAAAARTGAARFRVTVAEREAREATILDIVENTAAAQQVESSSDAATSSSSVTDSFMRQFITGRRTWLDVMNAVRESNGARIALVNAEISAMSSSARLLIRSCQWQATEIRADSAR
ncbi:TolC family protein [Sphingomonas humi]|uniref:TolC family protein n=1 Tax=Sphingomonas humi TaxID=335630 RepID=A0ABP7RWL2_9SPHN